MKFASLAFGLLCGFLVSCERPARIQNPSKMTDEELLEEVSDIAFEKLEEADGRMDKLGEPYQTVAIVYSAQGIIDNGGLQYFFESDWPNNPPYSFFADAYERIGRLEAATAIRNATLAFGFPNPELDVNGRRAFIKSNYDEDKDEISGWDDCICGDKKVWTDLAAWVRNHTHFQP